MPSSLTTQLLSALLGLSLVAAASAQPSPPALGQRSHALIDGSLGLGGPVAAAGALLATADDGTSHEGAVMCSAVLIAPDVALTAAHCVALVEADAIEEGWQLDWWVSFSPDVREVEGTDPVLPPDTVRVRRAVLHPDFDLEAPLRSDRLDAAFDIAVLLLDGPAPAQPVPMARNTPPIEDAQGVMSPVLIAGYGWTDADPEAPEAKMGVRAAGDSLLFEIGPHELRVGRSLSPTEAHDLTEKCSGDSGGPTFQHTAEGWRVIGLTSRGHADDPGCAIAGIDTRVDVFADWVDGVVLSQEPDGPRSEGCATTPMRSPGLVSLLLLGFLIWRRPTG